MGLPWRAGRLCLLVNLLRQHQPLQPRLLLGAQRRGSTLPPCAAALHRSWNVSAAACGNGRQRIVLSVTAILPAVQGALELSRPRRSPGRAGRLRIRRRDGTSAASAPPINLPAPLSIKTKCSRTETRGLASPGEAAPAVLVLAAPGMPAHFSLCQHTLAMTGETSVDGCISLPR